MTLQAKMQLTIYYNINKILGLYSLPLFFPQQCNMSFPTSDEKNDGGKNY